MAIIVMMSGRDTDPILREFARVGLEINVRLWPEQMEEDPRNFVLCWNQKPGDLSKVKNLRAITSFGAGVDSILKDTALPKDVPICRIIDPGLGQEMAEYVIATILQRHRCLNEYHEQQHNRKWQQIQRAKTSETLIGVLGMGQVGATVASSLAMLGFAVRGWSRTRKCIEGIQSFDVNELSSFLNGLDYLVCVLPLTAATVGFLDSTVFMATKPGVFLINVGRGAHVKQNDLLAALESGQVGGAYLDVFETEPLLTDHPFWSHPKIRVTPHDASLTDPASAVEQIVSNYRRLCRGEPLMHLVDRDLGY